MPIEEPPADGFTKTGRDTFAKISLSVKGLLLQAKTLRATFTSLKERTTALQTDLSKVSAETKAEQVV